MLIIAPLPGRSRRLISRGQRTIAGRHQARYCLKQFELIGDHPEGAQENGAHGAGQFQLHRRAVRQIGGGYEAEMGNALLIAEFADEMRSS
jgi:hypothetical protein